MALIFREQFRTLDSDSNYIRRKSTGEVFADGLFLGKDDMPDNYEEISEEEYNQRIQELEIKMQQDMAVANEEIARLQKAHENDPQPDIVIE